MITSALNSIGFFEEGSKQRRRNKYRTTLIAESGYVKIFAELVL